MSALPTVHETLVVLIELARTRFPATVTVTVPAQRLSVRTPASCPAVVADGAQRATAQTTARAKRRMSAILPLSGRANRVRYRREAE